MKIKLICAGCGAKLTANEKLFGKKVKCPKCGVSIEVSLPTEPRVPVAPNVDLPPAPVANAQQPVTLAPRPAAHRPASHRSPNPSPKSSPEQAVGFNKLWFIPMIGVPLLLTVIGVGVWASFGSGSVQKENGSAVASNASAAEPAVAANSAFPTLRYNYERQKEYLYEVEFECKDASGENKTTACSMVVSRNPDVSIASNPRNKCDANKYGTGIGLPGKRILVCSDVIRNAESIKIQIDDKSYPARLRPNPASAYISVLEYDGPDFNPVKVNQWHGYERYPFAIQRDPTGRLFMRGAIATGFNLINGPMDEVRVQSIQKEGNGKLRADPCSYFCRSGAMFDRTGTLYGLMSESEIIFPTAMLETCIKEEGLFSELPSKGRSFLTEQELVDRVGQNIVSVHAVNPVAAKGDLSRGDFKTVNAKPTIECGPFKFSCSSFERLEWQPLGNVTKFKSRKGSVPFFLGGWADLMLVDSAGQEGLEWVSDHLVARYRSERNMAKSKDWNPKRKETPGSLHVETKIVGADLPVATVERKISVTFPDSEQFNMPDTWEPNPEDSCSVEATQFIDFDRERGLILKSNVIGTLNHIVDDQPRADDFEVRIRLSKRESESTPEQLRKLSDADVESVLAGLGSEKKRDMQKALDALLEIQPEVNEPISLALSKYNPTSRGWASSFQRLAQRWILPQHMEGYLLWEISPAKVRSYELIDILRVVEFKPPVYAAKPYVRKALLEPERLEFRMAGRVVRNVYPEMADEIIPLLSNVGEFKDHHGEWVRCLNAVGKSNCVPALESYIGKVKSLGPRYHQAHARFVEFAQQAIAAVKTRPVAIQDVVTIKGAPRRRKSEGQLRKIVMAALKYHDRAKQQFPGNIVDENGKPLLSWRVALLPYLGQDELYKKFKLTEAWDSEHNLELVQQLPDVYRHPDIESDTKTVFLGFRGGGAVFEEPKDGVKPEGVSLSRLSDGSSNTIFCVEANPDSAVQWSKPDDILFDPNTPVTQVGKNGDTSFNVVFCDGSVRALANDFDPEGFSGLVGRNDQMPVRISK